MQLTARIYVNAQACTLDHTPQCATISAKNRVLFWLKAQNMDIANLLTIADFCQTVGISRSTWHKLKRNRMTPAIVTVGGIQRIRREAVENWLAENESKVSAHATHKANEGPKPLTI